MLETLFPLPLVEHISCQRGSNMNPVLDQKLELRQLRRPISE